MHKVAILISGSGTNMESVINYSLSNKNSYEISLVLSDREAKGIEKAKNLGVKNTLSLNRKDKDFQNELLEELKKSKAQVIVLAGFLSIIPETILEEYKDRIINIHPSLLPKYGGMGMHGLNVHKAVLENNEKESGCSVHIVTKEVDGGRVLIQRKVKVLHDDTKESLQKRVLEQEHVAIVEGLLKLLSELGE